MKIIFFKIAKKIPITIQIYVMATKWTKNRKRRACFYLFHKLWVFWLYFVTNLLGWKPIKIWIWIHFRQICY